MSTSLLNLPDFSVPIFQVMASSPLLSIEHKKYAKEFGKLKDITQRGYELDLDL